MASNVVRRRVFALLVFVVGLVVVDRVLAGGLRAVLARATSGELTGRINTVLDLAEDQDVLTFGTSRAVYHVDPRILESSLGRSALNLGSKGRGILYARMMQALLFERGARPEIVLLQVEPNDLYTLKPARAGLFAPYYDESPVVRAVLDDGDVFAPLRFSSHAYRYNGLIPSLAMNAVRSSSFSLAHRGFVPVQGDLVGVPPPSPEEVDVGEDSEAEFPLPQAVALYRDFVRDAQERGARVLMFTGPRFRSGPPALREQRGIDAFERLAEELDVPYRPMTEQDYPELASGALYFDPSHMNERGASRFSELLAEEVRELGWLEREPRAR